MIESAVFIIKKKVTKSEHMPNYHFSCTTSAKNIIKND